MNHEKAIINASDGSISISFDINIYSLNALKKAAYKFTDRASVLICNAENSIMKVKFSFEKSIANELKEKLVHEFCNEVLDQDLRETIASQTEATRNLILAQAFSKTSLLE
jgi:His-Xaa-Ser system protein HxsD